MEFMNSRDILQGNFLKFIWFVWTHVLALPKPTRIQFDIARYLSGGPRRRFIQAFRGIGKTFITAAYVVWRLWKNPNLKIMVVSANEAFATEIASFIKQIIDHPAGDDLWPELRARRGQRSSALSFDVGAAQDVADKSPSVKAVGIFGQLTGSRADILISDDVEVPKNAETEALREKLDNRTTEYAAIIKTDDHAEIIWLGTPQTQESIYRKLPEKGYGVRIWPARYPTKERLHNYQDFLAPLLADDIERDPTLMEPRGTDVGGAPTDPERFTEMQLIERETEYRKAGFLLQYMLDTSLSDADRYPLKTRDLIVTDVDRKVAPVSLVWGSGPDQVIKELPNVGFDGDRLCRPLYIPKDAFEPFTGSVMHIDPSGSGKDDTAYVVTKFLNGMVFIRRWGGFRDGFGDATLHSLAKIAAEEEVNAVHVEENFGDGMFSKLFEPVLARYRRVPVEGFKVSGQKEVRILSALEPVLRQHRVVIDTTVVRADLAQPDHVRRGLFQLTHLTSQRGALKHDDRVDVLAQAMTYWQPYLNADITKAEEEWKRKKDQEFFNGFVLEVGPKKPKGLARGTGRKIGVRAKGGRKITW